MPEGSPAARRPFAFLPAALVLLLFAGCTRRPPLPPVGPWGQGSPPESLHVDLKLTVHQGNKQDRIGARLYIRPWKQYKFHFQGPFKTQIAALLWDSSLWTLVLYEEKKYFTGKGNTVMLPKVDLPPIGIHELLSFLWGEPPDAADEEWRYVRSPEGGIERAEKWAGEVQFVYRDLEDIGGRKIPRELHVFWLGQRVLEVRAESVTDAPDWKRGPFRMKIPGDFEEVPAGRLGPR